MPTPRPPTPTPTATATRRALALAAASLALAACGSSATASSSPTVSTTPVTPPPGVASAPIRVAQTAAGAVGYREVGSGPPLLLIMGLGGTIDDWAPSFVDALAAHHTVVVFDNAGIGHTAALAPLTVPAMARQTSALISALRLGKPAVLGWSMGGMIAQALAVLHPAQVSALVLAATQPGTGRSLPIPPGAAADAISPNPLTVLSVLFPPDQQAAAAAYVQGILQYPGAYQASAAIKASQGAAIAQWMAGKQAAGRRLSSVHVPTLVADGTLDRLDPSANSRMLAAAVRRARLVLYPDAGHAFPFQDQAAFVPAVLRLLG